MKTYWPRCLTGFILLIALGGCNNLHKQQQKICLDTGTHNFAEIDIRSCGQSIPLTEVGNDIWSTDGPIRFRKCETFKIFGAQEAGKNTEIAQLYHFVHFDNADVTTLYEIVDLKAASPWNRVRVTGFVDGGHVKCTHDMSLPGVLK